jgi:hypothetical protein
MAGRPGPIRSKWLRPVDLERAARLAGIGVAKVRRDTAVLSLELRDRVKGPPSQAGDH